MVYPVARSNRVDGRGRGEVNSGGNSPVVNGITILWSRRCPKSGNNFSKRWDPHYWNGKAMGLLLSWILFWNLLGVYGNDRVTHEPFEWSLIREEEQKVIQSVISSGAPTFECRLFELLSIDQPSQFLELVAKGPPRRPIYICPASNPGKGYCNYPGEFYCGYWGCETLALGFTPGGGPDPYISVKWLPCTEEGICDRLGITVKSQTLADLGWFIGKTWGIQVWEPGKDRGGHFLIKKERIPHNLPEAIGPNEPLKNIIEGETEKKKPASSGNTTYSISKEKDIMMLPTEHSPPEAYDTFWKIMQASFNVLNQTHPELTKECWLCYDIRPPFYEAIGSVANIRRRNGTNPREKQSRISAVKIKQARQPTDITLRPPHRPANRPGLLLL
ncbi:endogenous retrovirus group S71 member 1 Env polyprotein-like [Poecile atricapillus]|uniref:endogenous retrovirus group S71 member 1 Env polyprotein-like n=1 Tax=Poecile atricapillus TaxID=48891 RepID=UPI0027386C2D|nr:endogenous retrovirus group S71 member 1 Env polyprotein-like [Poecile atricapillus]